ncbi:MAG: hypothetical protein IOB97_13300 [Methylobacterium sp.]|nr:hypothetical protein [Methylobacterium sp.]MCA3707660.1 hypothetical protein [Methylobacterium sp.]
MPSPVKINGTWTLNGVQLVGFTVTGTSAADTIDLWDWTGTPALSGGIMRSNGGGGQRHHHRHGLERCHEWRRGQ